MALGEVTPFPGLNSFFAGQGDEAAQTRAVRALIAERMGDARPLVLVTHQVNITALTGVFPASGALLLVYTGARAGTVALPVPPPPA